LVFLFLLGAIPPPLGIHSLHFTCGITTGPKFNIYPRAGEKGVSSRIARNSLSREITAIIVDCYFFKKEKRNA
jgi:hypothetical protein